MSSEQLGPARDADSSARRSEAGGAYAKVAEEDAEWPVSAPREIGVWWLQLVGGIIELVLGFWAAGY
jgi:hypothetical protein